jgi:hypothetical protein
MSDNPRYDRKRNDEPTPSKLSPRQRNKRRVIHHPKPATTKRAGSSAKGQHRYMRKRHYSGPTGNNRSQSKKRYVITITQLCKRSSKPSSSPSS